MSKPHHDALRRQAAHRGSGQLSLGFERPSPSPGRRVEQNLFFAIQPDAGARVRIEATARDLKDQFGLAARIVPRASLHISIQSIGKFTAPRPELVAQACKIGADMRWEPFAIRFDHAQTFNGRYGAPIVLCGETGAAALTGLHEALRRRMEASGLWRFLRRPYTPHLTCLYADRKMPRVDIAPIGWSARELVLVKSLVGQGRHEIVDRWPLGIAI